MRRKMREKGDRKKRRGERKGGEGREDKRIYLNLSKRRG